MEKSFVMIKPGFLEFEPQIVERLSKIVFTYGYINQLGYSVI